jgi:hypothetical protein
VADRQADQAALEAQHAARRLEEEVDGHLGCRLPALRRGGDALEVGLEVRRQRAVEPRGQVVAGHRAEAGRQPLDDHQDVRAHDDPATLCAGGGGQLAWTGTAHSFPCPSSIRGAEVSVGYSG